MSNVINVELPGGDSVFVELGGGAELNVQIGADAQLHVDVIGEGPRGREGLQGVQGIQGVSPAVTIAEITGGHSVTITDADHPDGQAFNVMDGEDGDAGPAGQDGVSPAVSVTEITAGHTVTITDADHPSGQSFDVMDGVDGQDGTDGSDGQDGVSPAVTIGTITGGHSVTITDADHPTGQTFNVMDGADGQDGAPGAGVASGGSAGQLLKKKSGTDYDTEWADATQVYPSAYCTTGASTAAKKANCNLWTATANSWLHVLIGAANTSAGALTLNINGAGAKPIYINGAASSSSNYTLPAGTYLVFYDGTNFHFRTDGKLPGNITGHADGDIALPSSPTTGQFLKWSGSAWVASDLPVYNGGVS